MHGVPACLLINCEGFGNSVEEHRRLLNACSREGHGVSRNDFFVEKRDGRALPHCTSRRYFWQFYYKIMKVTLSHQLWFYPVYTEEEWWIMGKSTLRHISSCPFLWPSSRMAGKMPVYVEEKEYSLKPSSPDVCYCRNAAMVDYFAHQSAFVDSLILMSKLLHKNSVAFDSLGIFHV